MRRIGDVIYADVDELGDGIVEFATLEDLEYAVTPTLSPSPSPQPQPQPQPQP